MLPHSREWLFPRIALGKWTGKKAPNPIDPTDSVSAATFRFSLLFSEQNLACFDQEHKIKNYRNLSKEMHRPPILALKWGATSLLLG